MRAWERRHATSRSLQSAVARHVARLCFSSLHPYPTLGQCGRTEIGEAEQRQREFEKQKAAEIKAAK
jgi:hypothetical protein